FALKDFALGIEFTMVRKDQVRSFAQEKVATSFDTEFSQAFDFRHQPDGINHDVIADDARLMLAQDAGRYEVKDVFLAFDVDGMSGVIATLSPHDDIRRFGQDVYDLTLAFVAPLRAHQNRIGHT